MSGAGSWVPTVSVVVPVLNGRATVAECISSLLRLDYEPDRLELIVVDNSSTDGTAAVLAEHRGRIRILHETVRGSSAARNTGIAAATGECIAFTDADCIVQPDWLRHLIPPLEDAGVGIAGGEIRSIQPCNRIELFGERLHDHRQAIEVFVPSYAITMNWASRRDVLEQAGLFDVALLRGADAELALRIRGAGYRIVYCPGARIFHRNPPTLRRLFAKGMLHGRSTVGVMGKAAPLGLAPPRRPLGTERRILRHAGRLLTGPDRFDQLCQVVFDSGKAVGETKTVIAGLGVKRAATWVLAAIAALFTGFYLASIGPYWNISPDSATYVGWAQVLANGGDWGSPPATPPVTSLVFAGVLALSPGGYVALNTATKLLILGAVALAFVLARRRAGSTAAWLVVVLSLASLHLHHTSTQLLSEPVYLFVSMAALVLLDETKISAQVAPRARRQWLAGGLLLVTALTRLIGLTLALAVLLVEAGRWARGGRPRLSRMAFPVLAALAVLAWGSLEGSGYASGWFRSFVVIDPWTPTSDRLSLPALLQRIQENRALLRVPGNVLLNSWSSGEQVVELGLHAAAWLTVGYGMFLSLRRRVTVDGVYLLLYLGVVFVHLLVGGDGDPRFLVPVVPLLFGCVVEAARGPDAFAARQRIRAVALGTLGAVYLVCYVGGGLAGAVRGVREAHSSPFGAYPIKRPSNYDAQRVALRLKAISRPEERYAAGMRDMFDVISERRGEDLVPAWTSPPAAFLGWLEQREIRYLLVDRTQVPLADSLLAIVRAYPEVFRPLEVLPRAGLYEVMPPKDR